MAQPHWLTRTKTAMQYAGNGALWLPGSTTWRPPGEVLRLLVQQAQTADVPTFTFTTSA